MPRQHLAQNRSFPMSHVYPESAGGKEWWLLDDKHERIHGTSIAGVANDNNSPFDPDVADAPEDIKRLGNDHHPLSNAKLSPNGYYNGFFHKDFQGNYAQKSSRTLSKKHHRNHPQRHMAVQLSDHDNDTDDFPDKIDNWETVQMKDHENDTDDYPEKIDDNDAEMV